MKFFNQNIKCNFFAVLIFFKFFLFFLVGIFLLANVSNCMSESNHGNSKIEKSSSQKKIQNNEEEEKKPNEEEDEKQQEDINTPQNPNDDSPIKYDPLFKDQWYLKNTGQIDGKVGIDINVEKVWQKGYLGQGMFVAVMDSLVDRSHQDLLPNLPLANIIRYKNVDCNKAHGTSVASIIAARDNDLGMQGIAPRATLYSYEIYNEGEGSKAKKMTIENVIALFQREENKKIAVYNGSFGDNERTYDYSAPLMEAMSLVTKKGFHNKGSSIVFSAGNLGDSATSANNLYKHHYSIITVNSVEHNKTAITFLGGQLGPNIWLAAPSASKFKADSEKILSANGSCKKTSKYIVFSSTSAAAPMVSGSIALLRQAYPKLTWRDVKLILAESARKIKYNEKNLTYQLSGLMSHDKTKNQEYSRHSGFGLIDVHAAFNLAEKWQLLPPMITFVSPTQNSPLQIKFDGLERENSLEIKNSGINYIESIQLKLVFETEKRITFTVFGLYLTSPDGKKRTVFDYNDKRFTFTSFAKKEKTMKTMIVSVNTFLGNDQTNGIWKLAVKNGGPIDGHLNKTLKAIKSWNLTIRGH